MMTFDQMSRFIESIAAMSVSYGKLDSFPTRNCSRRSDAKANAQSDSLANPFCWNPDVNGVRVEPGILWNKAQRSYFAVCTGCNSDVDYSADSNSRITAQMHAAGLDYPAFHGVAGEMGVGANHYIIFKFEEVVVIEFKTVDVNATAQPRARQPQIRGPNRGTAEDRAGEHADEMIGRVITRKIQERPIKISNTHFRVRRGAPARKA